MNITVTGVTVCYVSIITLLLSKSIKEKSKN